MVIRTADEILADRKFNGSLCGIYFLIYKHEVVYVGQSLDIEHRISVHRLTGEKNFDSWSYQLFEDYELDDAEAEYIVRLAPRYNITLPVNSNWVNLSMAKRKLNMSLPEIKRLIRKYNINDTNGYYSISEMYQALRGEQ